MKIKLGLLQNRRTERRTDRETERQGDSAASDCQLELLCMCEQHSLGIRDALVMTTKCPAMYRDVTVSGVSAHQSINFNQLWQAEHIK